METNLSYHELTHICYVFSLHETINLYSYISVNQTTVFFYVLFCPEKLFLINELYFNIIQIKR